MLRTFHGRLPTSTGLLLAHVLRCAGMPVTVYLLGLVFKTEKFSWPLAADVTLVRHAVLCWHVC